MSRCVSRCMASDLYVCMMIQTSYYELRVTHAQTNNNNWKQKQNRKKKTRIQKLEIRLLIIIFQIWYIESLCTRAILQHELLWFETCFGPAKVHFGAKILKTWTTAVSLFSLDLTLPHLWTITTFWNDRGSRRGTLRTSCTYCWTRITTITIMSARASFFSWEPIPDRCMCKAATQIGNDIGKYLRQKGGTSSRPPTSDRRPDDESITSSMD
jgi:hypothetical protein